jgi:hypothetical protein
MCEQDTAMSQMPYTVPLLALSRYSVSVYRINPQVYIILQSSSIGVSKCLITIFIKRISK